MEARMTEKRMNGWMPDLPDGRDLSYREELRPQNRLFKAIARPRAKYLKAVNLPRVYQQSNIGSCVGHGVTTCVAYALDFVDVKSRDDMSLPGDFSRLFAYYNARIHKDKDEGAYIREGVKGVVKYGLCEEKFWPYDIARWAEKPPQPAYADGAKRRAVAYYRIETLGDILDCIAQGFPVVFGMSIYDNFTWTGADGEMLLPGPENSLAGGHCMVIVGYSMKKRAFYVRNSWGPQWGNGGNCWVPFDYMMKHGADFWTIRRISTSG